MLGVTGIRQKVRCPRCREIVVFDPATEASDAAVHPTPEPVQQLPDWTARVARVEARLEKLEEQLAQFAARLALSAGEHSRNRDVPRMSSPTRDLRSSPPRPDFKRAPETPLRRSDGDDSENEPPRLVVITSPNSPASLIKYLETILAAEYTSVDHGRDPGLSERCGPGLTLVAAPSIGTNRFAATHRLLRAAGFTVNCQLDPNLSGAEIFVVAGSGAVLEKTAAELMSGRS